MEMPGAEGVGVGGAEGVVGAAVGVGVGAAVGVGVGAAVAVANRSPNFDDLDRIWEDLRHGLQQIFSGANMSKPRYMELYTHVYNYCTSGIRMYEEQPARPGTKPIGARRSRALKGDLKNKDAAHLVGQQLYKKLHAFLKTHLTTLTESAGEIMNDQLLTFYKQAWEEFRFRSKVIDGVFGYLNRQWVRREFDEGKTNVHGVYKLALVAWEETLCKKLHQQVTDAVLAMIARERSGQVVATGLISSVIGSYVELGIDDVDQTMAIKPTKALGLGIYKNHFETRFLKDTETFYKLESVEFLQQNPVTEYMKKVEQRLIEEHRRVEKYLHHSTLSQLMRSCENVLIQNHLDTLFNEFETLLKQERNQDLVRLYNLAARLHNSNLMDILHKHIIQKGRKSLDQLGDKRNAPKDYVNAILDVHNYYRDLIVAAFQSNPGFMAALDKACIEFINTNSVTASKSGKKSPELLARYCDILLKKSDRTLYNNEMEEMLNQVTVVLKYIDDKDAFEKFYSRMLANRLVSHMSTSIETEKIMITKLMPTCGKDCTSKLGQMCQNIELSRNLNDEFRKWMTIQLAIQNAEVNAISSDIDFHIHVLRSGSWPFTQCAPFTLPSDLESSVNNFTNFYNGKHTGRKLSWLYNHSKGELSYNGFQKKFAFQVSTFQMAVLLMFNTNDSYRVGEIEAFTGLSMDILLQILPILIKSKLLRTPTENKDELNQDSVVELFKEYNNRKLRVNLNGQLKSEAKQEQEDIDKKIEASQKYQVEAAIVRIMKMRQELDQQQLVNEVTIQLAARFVPTSRMMQKCLADLVEKEYLKRKANPGQEMGTYTYVA